MLGVPEPQQRARGRTPALHPLESVRRNVGQFQKRRPATHGFVLAQNELHLFGTVGWVRGRHREQAGGGRSGHHLGGSRPEPRSVPAGAPQALTRVDTARGSGSSSSGVRKRTAKERYLSRGRRHVRAMFCGVTRSGREREQCPPPPL